MNERIQILPRKPQANMVRIVSIQLHCGWDSEEGVINSFKMHRFLKESGIPYSLMLHLEMAQEQLDNLSSWVFDMDYHSRSFTSFPILMWQEVYDNYDVVQCVATTIEELQASRLLTNKSLIA